MLIKLRRIISLIVMYSFTCVYGVNYALAYSRLTPANFAYMYNMAANGEISKLATAMARGLNINAVNENGDTGVCVAARRYDATAYKTFIRLGADPKPECAYRIMYFNEFTKVAHPTPIFTPKGHYYGVGTAPFKWLGLTALVGGGVAIAFGGGGGGGSDDASGDNGGTGGNGGSGDGDGDGDNTGGNGGNGDSGDGDGDNTGGNGGNGNNGDGDGDNTGGDGGNGGNGDGNANQCVEGTYKNIICQANETCTQRNECFGCENCENICSVDICADGCYEDISTSCDYGCANKNGCGGCIECQDKKSDAECSNSCDPGCFRNLSCENGCEEKNSCGGCEKCYEGPNLTAFVKYAWFNNINNYDALSKNGENEPGTWGGIFSQHYKVQNSGDITLIGDDAVGIMSSAWPDKESITDTPMKTLGGDINNKGYISITGDNSIGILATSLTEMTNQGKIKIEGENIIGMKLYGSGNIKNIPETIETTDDNGDTQKENVGGIIELISTIPDKFINLISSFDIPKVAGIFYNSADKDVAGGGATITNENDIKIDVTVNGVSSNNKDLKSDYNPIAVGIDARLEKEKIKDLITIINGVEDLDCTNTENCNNGTININATNNASTQNEGDKPLTIYGIRTNEGDLSGIFVQNYGEININDESDEGQCFTKFGIASGGMIENYGKITINGDISNNNPREIVAISALSDKEEAQKTGIQIYNYGEISIPEGVAIEATNREVFNYGIINANNDKSTEAAAEDAANEYENAGIISLGMGTTFTMDEATDGPVKSPSIEANLIFETRLEGNGRNLLPKAIFEKGTFEGAITGKDDKLYGWLENVEGEITSSKILIERLDNKQKGVIDNGCTIHTADYIKNEGKISTDKLIESEKEIVNSGNGEISTDIRISAPKITNEGTINFYHMIVDNLVSEKGTLIPHSVDPAGTNETKFDLYGEQKADIDFYEEINVNFSNVQNVIIKADPGKNVTFVKTFDKVANVPSAKVSFGDADNDDYPTQAHQIFFYANAAGAGDNGETINVSLVKPDKQITFTMKDITFTDADNEEPGGVDIFGSNIQSILDGDYTIEGSNEARGIYVLGREASTFTINEDKSIKAEVEDGTVFGVWASGDPGAKKSGSVEATNNGNIIVTNKSDSYNAYGVKLQHGAYFTNSENAVIIVNNSSKSKFVGEGVGVAYGIYDQKNTTNTINNAGTIIVGGKDFSSGTFDSVESFRKAESTESTEAYGIYAVGVKKDKDNDGKEKITIDGTGEVTINNTGTIEVYGNENNDSTSAGIYVLGKATITNGDENSPLTSYSDDDDDKKGIITENAYGIYVDSNTSGANIITIANYGLIKSEYKAPIHAIGATVNNHGIIESATNGIYIENGNFYNHEGATVKIGGPNLSGDGITITGNNSEFKNYGTIDIIGNIGTIGIVLKDGAAGTNNGTITISGTDVCGVSYEGGDGKFSDGGEIISDGCKISANGGCIDPPASYSLRRGARFLNYGVIEQNGTMNLSSGDDSGEFVAGKNSTIKADEINGNLVAGSDITTGSNEDEYLNENTILADKINVNVSSDSAMFDSSLIKQNNSANILMTRKTFAEIMDDTKLAQYLEQNYQNNNRVDLFDELKSANDNHKLYARANELLGRDFLPLLALQNQQRVRYFNQTMEDLVLDNDNIKDERSVGTFVSYHNEQKASNLTPEYEDQVTGVSILFDKAINPNYRFGTGIGLYNAYADFDNVQTRRDNILQLYLTNRFDYDNWGAVVMPFAGYGHGEYKNVSQNKKYEPDFNTWYLGLNNRLFLKTKIGDLEINPTAELNVNNVYQDTIKENKHITLKAKNSLSAEAGIGLYAKQVNDWGENGKLDIRAGAMYYRELNHNAFDDITAQMFGMDGVYDIPAYQNDRNRTEISLKAEYKINQWSAFAEAKHIFQDNDNSSVNLGIKLAW